MLLQQHVKDPGHSAKSAGGRLQLNTHTRMYVVLHEVTCCMVVWCTQNLCRDRSSFMWHQPCQHCKYTTSVDIKKHAMKKLVTLVESHVSAVGLLESRE